MKGRRKKGIAAVIMAALMLVGLVPSDFTLVQAKAADTTYILKADDLTTNAEYGTGKESSTLDCGTDNYFKLNATDSTKTIKITGNKKTFSVDGESVACTKRIQLQKNAANTIDFTVQGGNTAKVTACVISSNSAAAASMVLFGSDGTVKYGPKDAPGTYVSGESEVVFENVEAGSYKLGTKSDSAKQANIYYIKVVESSAAPSTGTAPVISSATAALKDGTDNVAHIQWTIGTPAAGEGKLVVDVYKDGTKLATKTMEDAAATEYDYEMTSSGSYTFKVYGKLGTNTTTEAVTPNPVVYTKTLGKPSVTAKELDSKITLSWGEVAEATSYKVTIKDEAGTVVVNAEETTEKTFTKEGLTNLTKYTCTVTAVRSSDNATSVSDEIVCMPYQAPDTSSAIPGMNVINQTEDNQISISRTGGSIILSQPAAEGGIASSKITNSSFVLTPSAVTGDFVMSADITIDAIGSGTSAGIFFGAFTGTEENAKLATVAVRGDKNFNVYRTKNEAENAYSNGGSGKGAAKLETKYTFTLSRTGTENISIKVTDESGNPVVESSWGIKSGKDFVDFSEDLKGPVR